MTTFASEADNTVSIYGVSSRVTSVDVLKSIIIDKNTDPDIILREIYWKEVMMSRNKTFGYNNQADILVVFAMYLLHLASYSILRSGGLENLISISG